jgi:hypothetical protein
MWDEETEDGIRTLKETVIELLACMGPDIPKIIIRFS